MKKNVLLVGLVNSFNKQVAYEVSNQLSTFFLDVEDMLAYEIIDKENMLQTCGIDYLTNTEKKCVKNALSFEDTIINISYETFHKYVDTDLISKETHIIYIRLTDEQINSYLNISKSSTEVLSLIDYKDRDIYLTTNCDKTIKADIDKPLQAVKSVINYLKRNNYENKSNCN